MALSLDDKTRLAELKLPDDVAVRARLERWMIQTGWNDADIADAIPKADGRSYARSSVNLYRRGCYPGTKKGDETRAIRAALVELMDANPTALERHMQGKTYRTESYRKVRRAFFKALDRGWAYCVDGPPGTQKTRLLLSLCAELEASDAEKNGRARRALYVYCRPRMSRRDLLTEISMEAGIMPRGFIGERIRKLRHYFAARRVLLIIDEGQHLDDDGLETVRELLDQPPYFGLLFAGTHNLRRKFEQLELEQWRSRLQKFIELEGLSEDELREIWVSEVGSLTEKKVKELANYCRVRDYRKRDTSYLSARNLFFAIEQEKVQENDR
ncbi:MAG: ATP-binding protein [Acidobacteriia bacterium]|nr:ATP-binding protein [Terriglobia bacterium]